eukprot:CAMPEP_0184490286 /NCGR_PEP_ID=MMETSP0113_2-20130426/17472_1 /TAXON_ID=91329 /ORGANISM="Norrisiella sphaerica, Strain BC52" /LENGTH=213 /DNA_ID=CAMNT_0026874089 /DNA_START=106 /DNA_END=747 /DNA_ORIENTATION=+
MALGLLSVLYLSLRGGDSEPKSDSELGLGILPFSHQDVFFAPQRFFDYGDDLFDNMFDDDDLLAHGRAYRNYLKTARNVMRPRGSTLKPLKDAQTNMGLKQEIKDNEYVYKLPVNGYPQDGLSVSVDRNVVRLSGQRAHNDEKAGTKMSSTFDFSFTVPSDSKLQDITSSLDPDAKTLHVRVGRTKRELPAPKSVNIPIQNLQRSPETATNQK